MLSDSDSDFGDFDEATPVSVAFNENTKNHLSAEMVLKSLLGSGNLSQYERRTCKLESLLAEERPKIIYEQLVLLEPHLHPLKWGKSDTRSMLLRTLNIEDKVAQPIKPKILQDSLYVELEGKKNSLETLGVNKLNETVPEVDISTLLNMNSLENMPEEQLSIVHDQLITAISKVLENINELQSEEQELLADKSTFEQVIINLVGHTQRLRREEIALNKRKNKSKLKKK